MQVRNFRRFGSKLRWIGTLCVLVLTGALVGAFASNGGGAASAPDRGATSRHLDPSTLAKVQRTVRQFKDDEHTPGVLVGIWSPKGTFVMRTVWPISPPGSHFVPTCSSRSPVRPRPLRPISFFS